MSKTGMICVLRALAAVAVLSPTPGVTSTASDTEGLAPQSKLLKPGKLDFRFRDTESSFTDYNLIWWSPIFKGGFGVFDNDQGGETKYVGGFLRPLLSKPEQGEWIIGFKTTETEGLRDVEFQTEYRFPFGLGVGGGFVDRDGTGPDISFGKLSFRDRWNRWNYILEAQVQEVGDQSSAGGYVAFYDPQLMLTYGHDGEQWRSAFGYVAPENDSLLRPAFEILFVDNSVGEIPGAEFLFVNASLKFKGGFLSHPARLGRAMGPTGMEFGNPLAFLRPTWNRRLDVWELGGVADFRLVKLDFPNGTRSEVYEGVVFPFQWTSPENKLDGIFLGGLYSDQNGDTSSGAMAGFLGKLGFLQFSIQTDYNFDTDAQRFVFGIIDWF